MKTIRLLYPDHVSGGLDEYYLGAKLLSILLPENDNQPLLKVEISPPSKKKYDITDGIYAKEQVIEGMKNARAVIESAKPDKIITIGGNCIVSQASFDYLHGLYDNTGIVWIDAHPDVSTAKDGYPNAHAMVLGSLLGKGEKSLTDLMKNKKFQPSEIMHIGLQDLHDYQEKFLCENGIAFSAKEGIAESVERAKQFIAKFDHVLIHLDIDVLDPQVFHSTYFANKGLVGDGGTGGKMKLNELQELLKTITTNADIVGFTIAEYLPFDEYKLHKMFNDVKLFSE